MIGVGELNFTEKCRELFNINTSIEQYINTDFTQQISTKLKKDKRDTPESDLVQAITLLSVEAIRTYRACMILIKNGYSMNSFTNHRSLIDIIFWVEYILSEPDKSYMKAKKYLKNSTKYPSIHQKAKKTLNKNLYESYNILCGFTHENSYAAAQNIKDNIFVINPNTMNSELATESLITTFMVFLDAVNDFYALNLDTEKRFELPQSIKDWLNYYQCDKNVAVIRDLLHDTLGISYEEIDKRIKKSTDYYLNKYYSK